MDEIKHCVLTITNFEEPMVSLIDLINMKIEARDRKNDTICAPATISIKKLIIIYKFGSFLKFKGM